MSGDPSSDFSLLGPDFLPAVAKNSQEFSVVSDIVVSLSGALPSHLSLLLHTFPVPDARLSIKPPARERFSIPLSLPLSCSRFHSLLQHLLAPILLPSVLLPLA